MADRFAHPAHLTVASFADREQQHRIVAAIAATARSAITSAGSVRSAVERDAFAQTFERLLVGHAGDARFVGALDAVPRDG